MMLFCMCVRDVSGNAQRRDSVTRGKTDEWKRRPNPPSKLAEDTRRSSKWPPNAVVSIFFVKMAVVMVPEASCAERRCTFGDAQLRPCIAPSAAHRPSLPAMPAPEPSTLGAINRC